MRAVTETTELRFSTVPTDLPLRRSFATRVRAQRICAGMLAAVALSLLTGCTKNGGGGSGTTPTPPVTGPADFLAITGNWQMTGTGSAKGGPATPITLSGVIAEQGNTSSRFTTSTLEVQSPCYADAQIVPLDGQVTSARVQLGSFDVKAQTLTLDASKSSDANQLTGTYTIAGGCADGQAGNFTGQRVSNFQGTYSGTAAGKTVAVTVLQDQNGTGGGYFVVTGSAQFTGFSCITGAQIGLGGGTISGTNVSLALTANDAAKSQVRLAGQLDLPAQTLTLSTATVSGGSCDANLGSLVLTKQ